MLGTGVVYLELLDRRHVLPPDRVVRRLDQIEHRRRDPELEILGGLPQARDLREVLPPEPVRQRVERGDAPLTKQFLPGLHASDP